MVETIKITEKLYSKEIDEVNAKSSEYEKYMQQIEKYNNLHAELTERFDKRKEMLERNFCTIAELEKKLNIEIEKYKTNEY